MRKAEFSADEVAVAYQGGFCLVDGREYGWRTGDRLRGDHPAVVRMGRVAFYRDGEERPIIDLPAPNNDRAPVVAGDWHGLKR